MEYVANNTAIKITKIYTSAVLTIATLDTAVFEIGAFAKWLLKILVIMMAGLLAQLISTGCSTRYLVTTYLAI